MLQPWVLIDVSFLAHRARYATADLEYDDLNTGILFGFWEQLYRICTNSKINSNKIIFFFDSRQSYRKRLFSDYKKGRNKNIDDEERKQLHIMYDQIKLLRKDILPSIGFSVHRQIGLESDDLMAQTALQLIGKKQNGIIVTADGDLWQCINKFVKWYDPARDIIYDEATFYKKKKVEPWLWRKVKRLAGCSSDNVPGIPGIGEKTVIKYINNELPTHYKTYKAIKSKEGQKIIERNCKLVDLPHEKTKEVKLKEPIYNPDAFFTMCERYGFFSYLREPKKHEWEKFFSVVNPKLRQRKRKKK